MSGKRDVWMRVHGEIQEPGGAYGRTDVGPRGRVLVEFVSANPTGPLHIGHGRGAAVGQAIANLLTETGYDVVREYYINDAGRQMKLLGASVYARYRELNGRTVSFPEDGYRGAYIETAAAHIRDCVGATLVGRPLGHVGQRFRELADQAVLQLILMDL